MNPQCFSPLISLGFILLLLGSKTLGLNVLKFQFVMLANHDQNVFSLVLDLLKVCLYVKLESSVLQDLLCKSAQLDQSKIRLDQSKFVQIVFLQNFPTQPKPGLTCKVLCFVLSIKRKTITTFLGCSLCCVCEYFVRSRGICLHIHLGFPILRLMSRAW